MEERVTKLEADVAELKLKRRDRWDIVQIIGGLLLPFAVAFAGYYYSVSMKAAEIASADRHARAEEEVSRINSGVGEAGLVLQYLNELFGSDPKRRDITAKTIQKALPGFGAIILDALSKSPPAAGEPTPEPQVVATALEQRRAALVESLFALSGRQRNDAYQELTSHEAPWRKDPKLVDDLLNAARRHMDDPTGLRNVVVTFRDVSRDITQPRRDDIFKLAEEILKANPNVSSKIDLKEQIQAMKTWIPEKPPK
jgi:hypothetical protein